MTTEEKPIIAIIGGTGALGTGLARRWARAGYRIVIGSRSIDKAREAAARLRQVMGDRGVAAAAVEAMENADAAARAALVVLTVPFEHQRATLEQIRGPLAGKILVDATAPLVPPKAARVQLPPEGSAGQIAQALLGEGVRVVSAFQTVAADKLQEDAALDCDVLVCGDDAEAREAVIALVTAAGMRGLHAGPIANAAAAEALTSVIIAINRRYRCQASIRITGVA
jgi:NADPH-dependent F420 reductase